MNTLDGQIMEYLCVSWRCWCMALILTGPTLLKSWERNSFLLLGINLVTMAFFFFLVICQLRKEKILCPLSLPSDSSAHCQILSPCSPHRVTGILVQGSPFGRVSTFPNITWNIARDDLGSQWLNPHIIFPYCPGRPQKFMYLKSLSGCAFLIATDTLSITAWTTPLSHIMTTPSLLFSSNWN